MCFIIFRHRQNRDHRNTSVLTVLSSCSFINRSQICIHISRISAASRNFLTSSRHFTESIRIICNVCQNNEYMHLFFKGKILCCCKRHLRSCDTFDRRIICKVNKQNCSVKRSCFHEEVRLFKRNTHSGKHYGKVFICSKHLSLSCDLSRKLRVRQP